jgi:predicted peroxiredoxin
VSIVVHSDDMDKLYGALTIANDTLAMGMEASIFFTFWGLQRLGKDASWAMPPAGLDRGPLSKANMLGLGKWMIQWRMKKANVASLEKMMSDFIEPRWQGHGLRHDDGHYGHCQGGSAPRPYGRLLWGRHFHSRGPGLDSDSVHIGNLTQPQESAARRSGSAVA